MENYIHGQFWILEQCNLFEGKILILEDILIL